MEDSLEDYIKMVRNTKEGNKKDQQQKISDKDLIALQRKKQCEANAVKIVEFLIEGQLRPEVFLRCLKHINPSYYQDVVEERAISKLCGYPLCGKQIPDMPKKQYFVNTKNNKVYDVTDRKNYCSNLCYTASNHIKEQIDTSPLWLRKYEETVKYDLLSSTEKGSPGEEVDQGITKVPKDYEFTSVSSFAQISLDEIGGQEVKSKKNKKHKKPETLETLNECDEINYASKEHKEEPDITHQSIPVSTALSNNDNNVNKLENSNLQICQASTSSTNKIVNSQVKDLKSPKQNNVSNSKPSPPTKASKLINNSESSQNVFENLKKHVQEWITLETYIYLYGLENVKESLDETQLQQHFKKMKETEDALTQRRKYLEICQKLQLTQLAEDKFDSSVTGAKMKPVPDYADLKQESKLMDLKIKSFYSGVPYDVENNKKTESVQKETIEANVEEGPPAVLPLMETTSQTSIRRRIYLNSVEKAAVNLTHHLGLPSHYIMKDIQSLVKTFKLQAHNIVFKPAIWSLIALILIKMLSIRDNSLSQQLDSKQSQTFIKVMLQRFLNAETFLNELLESLKDVNIFLKQYISENNSVK